MSPLFSFRFDMTRDSARREFLLIFAAASTLDPEAFATCLEAEIEANLVPDELLVVVRDPSFTDTADALRTHSTHEATLARLAGRTTVTLIAYDYRGGESKRAHIIGPAAEYAICFEHFRRRAISSIFSMRQGFVMSNETYHFENPSGRHTERFIRLSNILVRGAEIAFIGFCALPYIPVHARIAYLDTPSLYAVVAAINEQRSSFPGLNSIIADNFSSYEGIKNYQFERIQEAFVLISASSSGSLAHDLIKEIGFDPKCISHLLFLGTDKSGSNIVCDLQWCEDENPEGVANPPVVEAAATCRMCAGGSFAIKLKGDQFEFAGPQQESLLINKNDAPEKLGALIGRTAGRGIFAVGLGKATGRQPRQFHVSADALHASPDYQTRLDYVLRRSLPASVSHVIILDDHSRALAEAVVARMSNNLKLVDRNNLDSIPKDTQSAILIAAAVVESGRSLLDVSRDLRSIVPKAPLLYLVGFSKTTGEARREALARNLKETLNPYPYEFIEVERMILPASYEQNAWTSEYNLLIDPQVTALVPESLQSVIQSRVDRLRRSSEALMDELFLTNGTERKLRLQPGFVFWPQSAMTRNHSQADVFFTIASVLQQLRANAQKLGKGSAIKSNWFQQTVLAPGNFGRYNDDVIQASILRAAFPFEMNYADSHSDSRELGRLIRRILESSHTERGGAATEFLLAMATRRLRLCPEDCKIVLATEVEKLPMVEFLLKVCRVRLNE